MTQNPLRTPADAESLKSPDDPRMYSGHDARLAERYRAAAAKSVHKELEGMARLIVAVRDDLDPATVETLLAAARRERERLRVIEDQVG